MRRGVSRSVTLGLVAMLGVLAAAAGAGAFPGRNGTIVYGWSALVEDELQGTSTTTRALRTVAPGGGMPRDLRSCTEVAGRGPVGDCDVAQYSEPASSPDGTRIAFDAGASLALLDADGGALRILPGHGGDDGEPAFSPTGTRLAFSSAPAGGRREVWVSDLFGARARRLTRGGGSAPAWSTRGEIAFVRGGQLFAVRPDGSRLRQLTRRGGSAPAWSPHGTQLAFVRRGRLLVMRADGSGLRTVRTGGDVTRVRWSPNGRRLLLELFDGSLVASDLNGGRQRELAAGGVGGTYNLATRGADWQPLR